MDKRSVENAMHTACSNARRAVSGMQWRLIFDTLTDRYQYAQYSRYHG